MLQGLRPKQGAQASSSRFQLLLERKLQAELAAKAQQELSVQPNIPCGLHYNPGFDFNQQSSTSKHPFESDVQSQILQSSLLGQMSHGIANSNYPMSGQMAPPPNGNYRPPSQNDNSSTLSNYHVMSSADTYSQSSHVPQGLGPQAVAPSYQPAPFRSQHYQRLLAAKLANSEQAGPDRASSLANDAAASFMQHWTDHTLDPNYPTPQELSFLPSTHSPLYQLFNSGYGQDQWQASQSYQDSTSRQVSSSQSLGSHAVNGGRYDGQGSSNARAMWPGNHLQPSETSAAAAAVPPFYPTAETSSKYAPWMNSYGQPMDDSDTASAQSSRAPGLSTIQKSESASAQSSRPVLPQLSEQLAGSTREASVHDTKDSGHGSSSSPQRAGGDLNEAGEDGEPKKAMLACHFCRGRKLKYVTFRSQILNSLLIPASSGVTVHGPLVRTVTSEVCRARMTRRSDVEVRARESGNKWPCWLPQKDRWTKTEPPCCINYWLRSPRESAGGNQRIETRMARSLKLQSHRVNTMQDQGERIRTNNFTRGLPIHTCRRILFRNKLRTRLCSDPGSHNTQCRLHIPLTHRILDSPITWNPPFSTMHRRIRTHINLRTRVKHLGRKSRNMRTRDNEQSSIR